MIQSHILNWNSQELLNSAWESFYEGGVHFINAIQLAQEAIGLQYNCHAAVESHVIIAWAHLYSGNIEAAEQSAQELSYIDDKSYDANLIKAKIKLFTSNFSEALQFGKRAAQYSKHNLSQWYAELLIQEIQLAMNMDMNVVGLEEILSKANRSLSQKNYSNFLVLLKNQDREQLENTKIKIQVYHSLIQAKACLLLQNLDLAIQYADIGIEMAGDLNEARALKSLLLLIRAKAEFNKPGKLRAAQKDILEAQSFFHLKDPKNPTQSYPEFYYLVKAIKEASSPTSSPYSSPLGSPLSKMRGYKY